MCMNLYICMVIPNYQNIPRKIPRNLEKKLRLKLNNLYSDRKAIFDEDKNKEDEDYNIDEFIAELILEANPQLRNSEDEYVLRDDLTLDVRNALNYEYPMIKNLT